MGAKLLLLLLFLLPLILSRSLSPPIPFISLSSRCQLMNESARFQMRTTDWTRSNLAIERVVCVCVSVCTIDQAGKRQHAKQMQAILKTAASSDEWVT
ncbi:hypothetical protein RDWZM_008167, partial [Blomia tropicalis]